MISDKIHYTYILASLILIAGIICNFIAITENEGYMPVKLSEYYDFNNDKHISYIDDDEVNYPFFTDIFRIGKYIISIGDILIITGIVLMGYYILLIYHYQKRQKFKYWARYI